MSTVQEVSHTFTSNMVSNFSICYTTSALQGDKALVYDEVFTDALPQLYKQMLLIMAASRAIYVVLKPFHQIHFVAELLAAIVLGYSGFGRLPDYLEEFFPFYSINSLETLANYALVYHIFVTALEGDITYTCKIRSKSLSIGFCGLVVPAATGVAMYFVIRHYRPEIDARGCIFWALALSVTCFPELVRILTNQKLLYTDLGMTVITSAILNDLFTWIFLTLAICVVNNGIIRTIIIIPVFILTCAFILGPAIKWLIRTTSEGEVYKQYHYRYVVAGISLFALFTDVLGMQPFIGAFVFGLMIPNGELKKMILERLQDMATGVLMPLYFLAIGLKLKLEFIALDVQPMIVVAIVGMSCLVKILSTFLVFCFNSMSLQETWAIGLLLNTKGILAVIVLEAGRSLKVLDYQTYSIMMISILVMTFMVGPLVAMTKKPTKRVREFKPRSITKMKPREELRILTAIHSTGDVSGMINMLEASNAMKRSPISVYSVHLVELTGRASAMLIVHDIAKPVNNPHRKKSESEKIIAAFEKFVRTRDAISVQILTAVSPYTTMHEDVCGLADDKSVHLILLPFHKQSAPDGRMEEDNPAIRALNQNVLETAQCSVGIFIYRKLELANNEPGVKELNVAVFFFGGPDDREALFYAWRMAGRRDISLTVVRFLPGKEVTPVTVGNLAHKAYEKEKQLQLDSTSINQFKFNSMSDQNITYLEKVVNNGEETLSVISGLEKQIDMYIVGRGQAVLPALTSGLSEWSDCPELGALGDTLVSSDFSMSASVLVIQQFTPSVMFGHKGVRASAAKAVTHPKQGAAIGRMP